MNGRFFRRCPYFRHLSIFGTGICPARHRFLACRNGMLCAACDNEWIGETRWSFWHIEYVGALQKNG